MVASSSKQEWQQELLRKSWTILLRLKEDLADKGIFEMDEKEAALKNILGRKAKVHKLANMFKEEEEKQGVWIPGWFTTTLGWSGRI